jgi:hypothetical protein
VTRAVYVIGPPGVGKTTAVRLGLALAGFRTLATDCPLDPRWPLLRGQMLHRGGHSLGVLLGVARQEFAGTDGLSMAVHPQAVAWARGGLLPAVVVGEGQRLATAAFLLGLHQRCRVLVLHLTADPATTAHRRWRRGHSKPNARWVEGATTRAANVAEQARRAGLSVHTIDTTDLPPRKAGQAVSHLLCGRWVE